jgi:hypothetical protein
METKAPGAESLLTRPRSPDAKLSTVGDDPVDVAGKNVLEMIQRAANAAGESSKLAIGIVQDLSAQLQTANNRAKELEAKLRHCQDQVERSQKWFTTISAELQRQFLELPANIPVGPAHNASPSAPSYRAKDGP